MSRSLGGTRFTTLPPIAISPSVISSRPAIMRKRVDLPQPDGPTSTQTSPSALSTSTPRITWVVPKCLWTVRIATPAKAPPLSLRRPPRTLDHDVVRATGREPGDDVLRGFPPQIDFRLHAEERGVRRQDHLRVAEQRVAGGDRLDRQDVQPGAGKYSTIECRKQIADLDHRAARRVHEIRSWTHPCQHVSADHATGFDVERDVNAHDVARREQSAEIRRALDVCGKVAVDEGRVERRYPLGHVA